MGPNEAIATLKCLLFDIRRECEKHGSYPPGEAQRIQALKYAIEMIEKNKEEK